MHSMTYRKFMTLLAGLSPNSALGNVCSAMKDSGATDTTDDPASAERALKRAWGL